MSIVAKKIMMGSGAVALPSDDQFNRVSFLSHFEGSNNGVNNVFDDGSASNHTITANGNVTQGSFGPFARPDGEWGWSFDGDGDSLTFTNDATMSLDGDYTFELFFNAKTIVIDTQHPNTWLSGTTQLFIHSSGKYISWYADSANIVKSADDSILTNVWNHVAVVRSGTGSNNTSLYLNGTRVQQATNTATLGAGSGTARIGSYSASGGNFDGHISNIRILKGTALYSGSSITVPTSKLTAITNTKLLTCQSNRFVDNSSTGFALTPVGNPAVTAFGPFLTSSVYDAAVNGASGYFDGTGDYVHTPQSAYSNTGSFTAEAWVYTTVTDTGTERRQHIIAQQKDNDASRSNFNLHIVYATQIVFVVFSAAGDKSAGVSSNTGLSPNTWTHIAGSFDGSNLRLFVNGVLKDTTASTNAPRDTTQPVAVGARTRNNDGTSGTEFFQGYISDARLTKSAVYTSAFTPSTAPLTAITNTKLLLNMADGQAIDSAAQNNLTLAGNANTSTDQAKFGTASLHLDGTGDYAEVASSIGAWGTGNFTVEGWYYLTAQAQYDNLFDFRTSGNTSHLDIYFDDDPLRLHVFFGGSDRINANAATPTNEWVHIAVVRNGSTTTLYQNGTSLGTSTTVTTFTEGALRIGNRYSGDYYMQGYVDDFRVSHMARYTSNFTVPSAAFADKGQDA